MLGLQAKRACGDKTLSEQWTERARRQCVETLSMEMKERKKKQERGGQN